MLIDLAQGPLGVLMIPAATGQVATFCITSFGNDEGPLLLQASAFFCLNNSRVQSLHHCWHVPISYTVQMLVRPPSCCAYSNLNCQYAIVCVHQVLDEDEHQHPSAGKILAIVWFPLLFAVANLAMWLKSCACVCRLQTCKSCAALESHTSLDWWGKLSSRINPCL